MKMIWKANFGLLRLLDLVPFDELYGDWSVILVVKNGSGNEFEGVDCFSSCGEFLKE